MNLIDILFILLFIGFVASDMRRGFLRVFAGLLGMVLSFSAALVFYIPVSLYLSAHFDIAYASAKPISFIVIWLALQVVFFFLSKIVSYYTPTKIKESRINQVLAFFPAVIKGLFLIILLIVLLSILPLPKSTKAVVNSSKIARLTAQYMTNIENSLERFFGESSRQLIDKQLVSDNESAVILNFQTTNMTVDQNAEDYILSRINIQRQKMGVAPLTENSLIQNVARANSREMLTQGYFSHVSFNGQTLFDRLTSAKINFNQAAENLALAPTPQSVENGLENSPKHKANMLNPAFTQAGIGVENAGKYGLMVTEDFTN
jgi:uncharacterized protein YkwD